MNEEKRTIKINPDLFKVSGKTRKNQPRNTEGKDIRVKSANAQNKTTKGKVLRYIREQQEKNYKKLFEENKSNVDPMKRENPFPETSSEFENSINYLKSIEENNKLKIPPQNHMHNHTIKHRPIEQNLYTMNPNTSFLNSSETMSHAIGSMPHGIGSMPTETMSFTPKPPAYPPPQYGCLKNGNLPTYRTMLRQTAKAPPSVNSGGYSEVSSVNSMVSSANSGIPMNSGSYSGPPSMNSVVSSANSGGYSGPPSMNSMVSSANSGVSATNHAPNIPDYSSYSLKEQLKKEQIRKIMEKNKLNEKMNEIKQMPKLKGFKQKQKKTIRRTYHTGKSKVFSKVGVLVSNRTIRNNITTQMHKLKEIPMQDIRKFLIQKGLIKVGSTAPNDVLRQMYENSVLIGGELINHNTENLLYNYLNEDASSKTTAL